MPHLHAAWQPVFQLDIYIFGTHPLSKDAFATVGDMRHSLVALWCHNERLALNAGHICWISPTQVAVLQLVQFHQHSPVH